MSKLKVYYVLVQKNNIGHFFDTLRHCATGRKEEFLKKGRKKAGKEKSDKTHVKQLYEALMTAKNPQKQGRILEGGGGNFLAGQNIYPCVEF